MNTQHFQIYEASFNHIGNILVEEYDNSKQKNTADKIKCINQMYMYTNTLQIDYNILMEKYKNLKSDYDEQIQKLNIKLNEANNIVRLKNLGSKRFTNQNAE